MPHSLPAALTLQGQLLKSQNRPSGFDYMRLVLAFAVILFHSVVTSYGMGAQDAMLAGPLRAPIALVLPMFFALSGFLVAGSLERSKLLASFLGLRVLRIVPALAVEVTLAALILGPLLTTLPLAEYFRDERFYSYFLNILGEIHYELPGLFPNNPNPHTVNGQLWTVPWELACYIVCSAFAIFGIFRNRHWLLWTVLAAYGAHFAKLIYKLSLDIAPGAPGAMAGHTLVMVFATGLLFYRYRDVIAFKASWFWLSSVLTLALLAIPPHGDGFVAIPVTYMTVYLGLLNPPRQKLLLSGDYSYGMFLYGYSIQQAVASVPAWQSWYMNLLIATPAILVVAVGSWWLVEKPSLGARKYLKQFEEWWLTRRENAKGVQTKG